MSGLPYPLRRSLLFNSHLPSWCRSPSPAESLEPNLGSTTPNLDPASSSSSAAADTTPMETILLRVEYPSSAPPCVLVSFDGGRRGTIRSAPLGCPPVPSSPGEILPSDERAVPPPFRSSLSSTLVVGSREINTGFRPSAYLNHVQKIDRIQAVYMALALTSSLLQ